MSKIPYGYEADPEDMEDDPWTRLDTIRECLEDQEKIPPFLAHWLGRAIERSNQNPKELLTQLGLRPGRGKPSRHDKDAWLQWGLRVCDLEDEGLKREKALETAMNEYSKDHPDSVDRRTMQNWRDRCAKVLDASRDEF